MKLYDAGFWACRQEIVKLLNKRIIKGENETYHIYWNNVFGALRDDILNLAPEVDKSPDLPQCVRHYDD
jgi:hypothetical protein